ncbi:MAG: AAA family ATPase [Fimbriimonas sp.]
MGLPIFFVSGPPAAGKSTLCAALLRRFERAVHLPMDDLREWVVRGMADSVPWTEETERQFQLAEDAGCDVVRRYQGADFAVAVDHCRNPQRLEALIQARLADLPVVKVCLMPDLEENLRRSHTRTNKSFGPHHLDETILFTNERYRRDVPPGWLLLDNSEMTVEATVERILGLIP